MRRDTASEKMMASTRAAFVARVLGLICLSYSELESASSFCSLAR